MRNLAQSVSEWFANHHYIQEEDVDQIRFALEVVISNSITFLTIFFIGIFTHKVTYTIIFIIVLALLRTFDDTFHSKTFGMCFFVTLGSYIFSVFGPTLIVDSFTVNYILLSCGISSAIMFGFLLGGKRYRDELRLESAIITMILSLVVVVVTVSNRIDNNLSMVVSNVLMIVSLTYVLGNLEFIFPKNEPDVSRINE